MSHFVRHDILEAFGTTKGVYDRTKEALNMTKEAAQDIAECFTGQDRVKRRNIQKPKIDKDEFPFTTNQT